MGGFGNHKIWWKKKIVSVHLNEINAPGKIKAW
jgi:hypothetical protein